MKKYAHKKNISYKEPLIKKEIWLDNKVKCFTGNNNRKVWSDKKFLFWFAKDQHWMEIKWLISGPECHSKKCGSDLQTYKQDVLENLGLQISGISREHSTIRLC